MYIDRAEIIAVLQARGQHARADWVERALPPLVDISKNSSLLQTLNIDPADMSPVTVDPADASSVAVDPADTSSVAVDPTDASSVAVDPERRAATTGTHQGIRHERSARR